jgi:hypothetical protein
MATRQERPHLECCHIAVPCARCGNVSRHRIRVRVRNHNRNGRVRADLANSRLLRLCKLKGIDNARRASLDPEKPYQSRPSA